MSASVRHAQGLRSGQAKAQNVNVVDHDIGRALQRVHPSTTLRLLLPHSGGGNLLARGPINST